MLVLSTARRSVLPHLVRGSWPLARTATGSSWDERSDEQAQDVKDAQAAAAAARQAPAHDAAFAAGLPEVAGRGCTVRPVMHTRSGEPALASPRAWRVLPDNAENEAHRFIEPLMGWTGSPEPFVTVRGDELEFSSARDAVSFAARQGWAPEVEAPPPMPRTNRASIPGAPIDPSKPVPYAANFSVQRGGVPVWPRPDTSPDEPPPYDVPDDSDVTLG